MRAIPLIVVMLALLPTAASANETADYVYDAKGRLTKVVRSGSVNNGIVATYTFDRADNRTGLTVTGSLFNSPPRRFIVVPLRGGTPIPLPTP